MTRPTVIFFGPDGPPSQGGEIKVFLRTLALQHGEAIPDPGEHVRDSTTWRVGSDIQYMGVW